MDPEDGQIDVDPQVADDDQLSLTGNLLIFRLLLKRVLYHKIKVGRRLNDC